MSTQSNGSNGNGNKPVVEAASADSEVGSAVSGRIAPPRSTKKGRLHFRPGSALVPGMRRLRNPEQRAEGYA